MFCFFELMHALSNNPKLKRGVFLISVEMLPIAIIQGVVPVACVLLQTPLGFATCAPRLHALAVNLVGI